MANIEVCPLCKGSGQQEKKEIYYTFTKIATCTDYETCPACEGKGFLPREVNYVEDMQALKVEPGDVIVLRHSGAISEMALNRLKISKKECFPDNKILVLEEDMKIGLLRKSEITTENENGN